MWGGAVAVEPMTGGQKEQPLALASNQIQVSTSTSLGSISGKVLGLDATDVGMANVTAWSDSFNPDGYYKGYSLVNSDFSFRIDSLSAGRYFVTAWADGYQSTYFPGVSDWTLAEKVVVLQGAVTPNINLRLTKLTPGTGSISGQVVDEAGHPIPNVAVYADAGSDAYSYGKSLTDTDGQYLIQQLKGGKYKVHTFADGYLTEYFDNVLMEQQASMVSVVEPNETPLINFKLGTGGCISGTVLDQKGKPMAGVTIEIIPVKSDSTVIGDPQDYSSMWAYGITDDNGYYRVSGLVDGSYWVSATISDPWYRYSVWYPNTQDQMQAEILQIQSGQEIFHIDFSMHSSKGTGGISGKVVDRNGQPVVNAGVYLQSQNEPGSTGPFFGMSTQSDKEGGFNFGQVPAGSFLLSCWAQSGWQTVYRWWPDAESMENAKVIVVDEDQTNDNLVFNLPLAIGYSSISGYVHDKNGRPLQWASVQVSPLLTENDKVQYSAWAYTDSTGFYRVEQLTSGTYNIYASFWENQNMGQQWWNGKDIADGADGLQLGEREKREKIDFELALRPIYGTIVGAITDAATGNPIPRAFVEIKTKFNWDMNMCVRPFWFYPRYVYADEKGRFIFDSIREGSYTLAAYCNGGFAYYPNGVVIDQAEPVKVIGGEKTIADFKLALRKDGNGIIQGTVNEDNGVRPLEPGDGNTEPGSAGPGFVTTAGQPLDMAVVVAKPVVSIMLWPQSEMFYTALTEKDGAYQLTGLPAGEYYVKSFSPNHMAEYFDNVIDPAKATLVTVNGEAPTTGIDFGLSPMYWMYLKGGEIDNRNATGPMVYGRVTDNAGNPVTDATVYLLDESGRAVSYTNTGSDGSYQLAGSNPGNYRLQVGKVGYATNYNSNAGSLESAPPVNIGNGSVQVDLQIGPKATTVKPDQPKQQPETLALYGNYPNPFNPSTQIRFNLPTATEVKLTVFDIRGKEVTRLIEGRLDAGLHAITWDAKGVATGIYLYYLQVGNQVRMGKMVLVK